MLKNISKLEHIISNRIYTFFCENDSPIIDTKEALFQFQKYVGQIEDMIKVQQVKATPTSSNVVPIEPSAPSEPVEGNVSEESKPIEVQNVNK